MLRELSRLLLAEGCKLYPRFRQRVQRLTSDAGNIGWGYGDALREYADMLEDKLANGEKSAP